MKSPIGYWKTVGYWRAPSPYNLLHKFNEQPIEPLQEWCYNDKVVVNIQCDQIKNRLAQFYVKARLTLKRRIIKGYSLALNHINTWIWLFQCFEFGFSVRRTSLEQANFHHLLFYLLMSVVV